MTKENISVVGLGYVGLTTAVGFGLKGYKVVGIDTSQDRVDRIEKRLPVLFEEGLDQGIRKTGLRATTNYDALLDTDITFICVNTPSNTDGSMNGEHLSLAAQQLSQVLRKKSGRHLAVVRSTTTPGSTDKIVAPILRGTGICVNPEFLREGRALQDFLKPSRVVIGSLNKDDGDRLEAVYRRFECPIIRTDFKTAEMIKYASNAFLAAKISLINEIGNICKKYGLNVYEVAAGMGYDSRIGAQFLNAGAGFGGACFPKDLRALISEAKAAGYDPGILRAVLRLNEEQPNQLVSLLEKHLPVKGKTIGVLGLAFKPETDDIREARAVVVVDALLRKGARVRAYDPQAMANFKLLFPGIEYTSAQEVLDSDAVIIVTEWPEFEKLDYKGRIVIDGRNIRKAREAKIYEGICW